MVFNPLNDASTVRDAALADRFLFFFCGNDTEEAIRGAEMIMEARRSEDLWQWKRLPVLHSSPVIFLVLF